MPENSEAVYVMIAGKRSGSWKAERNGTGRCWRGVLRSRRTVSWYLFMQAEQDVYNQEAVEWGIRRESPYVRERKAYKETEDIKDGKQCSSSSNAGERSY